MHLTTGWSVTDAVTNYTMKFILPLVIKESIPIFVKIRLVYFYSQSIYVRDGGALVKSSSERF